MKAPDAKPINPVIWSNVDNIKNLLATDVDWESLIHELTDDSEFDQLISALQAAVERHESLWFLLRTLENSGLVGLSVAHKVRTLVLN